MRTRVGNEDRSPWPGDSSVAEYRLLPKELGRLPEDGPQVRGRSSTLGGASQSTDESQEFVDVAVDNGVLTVDEICAEDDAEGVNER